MRIVAVLSEHVLFRQSVAQLLERRDVEVLGVGAVGQLVNKRIDVVLIDLDHATMDTRTLVRQLHHQHQQTHIVLLGTPIRLAAALDGFANAEVDTTRAEAAVLVAATNKRGPKISAELARLQRQWAEVTPRQHDVLRWLATGRDTPAIALKLRVSERAVKAHISALLRLFNLRNRTELALLARDAGLRPPAAR